MAMKIVREVDRKQSHPTIQIGWKEKSISQAGEDTSISKVLAGNLILNLSTHAKS